MRLFVRINSSDWTRYSRPSVGKVGLITPDLLPRIIEFWMVASILSWAVSLVPTNTPPPNLLAKFPVTVEFACARAHKCKRRKQRVRRDMTQKAYHFISGLPRSGSTLMSAILRQNPRFSAGMSGPIASLMEGIVAQVSAGSELSAIVTPEQRLRILRGLFDSYYAETEAEVIFDTNRAWTSKIAEAMALFPDAKFICCVRNVAWVMDSLELQFRSKTFENTGLFNTPAERGTVYTRTEALSAPNRLAGFAYQALREACFGPYADRLVIVDYDILTAQPRDVIKLIYQFLGEPEFDHDLDAVAYDAPAFDDQLRLDGLHRVRPKVAATPDARFCRRMCLRNLRACRSGQSLKTAPRFGLFRDHRARPKTPERREEKERSYADPSRRRPSVPASGA